MAIDAIGSRSSDNHQVTQRRCKWRNKNNRSQSRDRSRNIYHLILSIIMLINLSDIFHYILASCSARKDIHINKQALKIRQTFYSCNFFFLSPYVT